MLSACQVKINVSASKALGSSETSTWGALSISPASKTLVAGNSFTFNASGGSGTRTFSVVTGGAGGAINASTGAYTAPGSPGTDTVRVTDPSGATVESTVTVLAGVSISPSSLKLSTNEQHAFSSSGGLGGYAYSLHSGPGAIDTSTGLFTASSSAGSTVLRATDTGGNFAASSLTTAAFLQDEQHSVVQAGDVNTKAATADSAGNLYVVGSFIDDALVERWIVRKWDGSSWSTIDTYQLQPGYTATATSVTADSFGNVYVAGHATDSLSVTHWIIRKWNGTAWSTHDDFQLASGKTASAQGIALDGSGNLYVAGRAYDAAASLRWIVRKWDGSAWSVLDNYAYSSPLPCWPNGIATDSSGNVYVVGTGIDNVSYSAHWLVRKWNGSAWSVMEDFQLAANLNAGAQAVTVDSSGKVFVGGGGINSSFHYRWIVRVWNGAVWSTSEDYVYSLGQAAEAASLLADPSGNVYAAGSAADASGKKHWIVRKWDGSAWSLMEDHQLGAGQDTEAWTLARDSSAANLYAAGKGRDAGGSTHWLVRKWNGSAWSALDDLQNLSSEAVANAVTFDSSGGAYVAGESGDRWVVRRMASGTWSSIDDYALNAGSKASAHAIVTTPSGLIYVAGHAMDATSVKHWIVRKWDGSAWSTLDDYQRDAGKPAYATGLTVDSLGHVYVVGAAEVSGSDVHWIVRKWNGSSWSTLDDYQLAATRAAKPNAVARGPSDQVYVAGKAFDPGSSATDQWIVRKWDGSSWSTLDAYQLSPDQASFAYSIAVDSGGDVYVAGTAYDSSQGLHWILRRWNGSSWSSMDDFQLAANRPARAQGVAFDQEGKIYVAGKAQDASGIEHWIVRKKNSLGWSLTEDFLPSGTGMHAWASGIAFDPMSKEVLAVGTVQDSLAGHYYWHVRKQP